MQEEGLQLWQMKLENLQRIVKNLKKLKINQMN
jgi:hypothetical protein